MARMTMQHRKMQHRMIIQLSMIEQYPHKYSATQRPTREQESDMIETHQNRPRVATPATRTECTNDKDEYVYVCNRYPSV